LVRGVTPQGLIQQDVRSVLAYLKVNREVDATRLGLVGEGLAATIAAAINPDISAAVVLDEAPELATMIKELSDADLGKVAGGKPITLSESVRCPTAACSWMCS
jgi:dienelactone hydrolase